MLLVRKSYFSQSFLALRWASHLDHTRIATNATKTAPKIAPSIMNNKLRGNVVLSMYGLCSVACVGFRGILVMWYVCDEDEELDFIVVVGVNVDIMGMSTVTVLSLTTLVIAVGTWLARLWI